MRTQSAGGEMIVREGERGEGRLGTILGLCVLLIAVYLGFKVVPVMVNAYSFRDFIEQEARFASLKKADEEVTKRVLIKAEELDLPVGASNVQVRRTNTYFQIDVKYTVPIKTPVYTYNWVFDESSRASLF